MQKVAVIGAGSVGVNTALFLDKLGFEVTLLEQAGEILEGASQATFVTHADGLEYYKPEEQNTGKFCIDGIITKQLLYPEAAFRTAVCTAGRPIRFLISKQSEGVNGLTQASFSANAELMRAHFAGHYHRLYATRGKAVAGLLNRTPETFARQLSADDYADCAHIAGGYAGTSSGIHMPHYYAFLKAALRDSCVKINFRQDIKKIVKSAGQYNIYTNDQIAVCEHVIITAGHHLPAICATIDGAHHYINGTFYLNGMTIIRLPATAYETLTGKLTRINFTLQQEGGCMFACILPPTAATDGLAAVYYPSEKGSQFQKHGNVEEPPPKEWDDYVNNGVANDHPNIQNVLQQCFKLYPFLRDYARIERTIFRTVFNPATPNDRSGLDRRVREIVNGKQITADGRVMAYSGPKWTNVELVALMAVNDTLKKFGRDNLAVSAVNGFGPEKLDVEQISRQLNFKHIKANLIDAYHYCEAYHWPAFLVDPSAMIFQAHCISPENPGK